MSRTVRVDLEWPDDFGKSRLPDGVQTRLQHLLDRQDQGAPLTEGERREAVGLVAVAELMSLLRLRAERAAS